MNVEQPTHRTGATHSSEGTQTQTPTYRQEVQRVRNTQTNTKDFLTTRVGRISLSEKLDKNWGSSWVYIEVQAALLLQGKTAHGSVS